MSLKRAPLLVFMLGLAPLAFSQAWSDAYEKALASARNKDWVSARGAFQEAIAVRPEDQSGPTNLPGPVTEPRRWRDGAPYSPNFGAAYASFKLAEGSAEVERKTYLEQAMQGFETLVAKRQISAPTLYFLDKTYGMLNMPDKQRELQTYLQVAPSWRVDTVFLTPEENANITSLTPGGPATANPGTGTGPVVTVVQPGKVANPTALAGPVPVVPTKFALIIGNTLTQMGSGSIAFASSDAMVIRQALVQNAGYDDKNVVVVSDATSGQIMTAAKALASTMPSGGTVLIYFSGIGVNIDGKDYYAGVDAAMSTDTNKMVAKEQLMQVFRDKGAQIFSFSQANRPIDSGRYFGMEVPLTGRYAQCQATSPGGQVFSAIVDDKPVGIYTKAFVDTLALFRSNRVPVVEFCWAVFQMMQGAGDAREGGGTPQVPSNPIINQMGTEAAF
ncbi:MAG: caspase family protein [Armatimonadetes bacterium]|nr:caspase family protein [Armatimonadota bacterium]